MMKFFHRLCWFLVVFSLALAGLAPAWAQNGPEVFYPPGMEPPGEAAGPAPPAAVPPVPAAAGAPPEGAPAGEGGGTAELPRSFRKIALGMGLEDLKTALQEDGMFNFRGDRDVSFLPSLARSGGGGGTRNLVETTGPSFIRRAFFQLREGELFIMGFALHTGMVDFYSVFTGFVKKYGEPSWLDPKQAVWETENTRLSLERPLTVKYIDMRIFNELIGESTLVETGEVRRRQEFLDEF